MKKILVLTSAEEESQQKAIELFCDEIGSRLGPDVQVDGRHYNQLAFSITNHDFSIEEQVNGLPLQAYDLVFFKSYVRYWEPACAVADFLKSKNIKFACSELLGNIATTKLTQYARLAVSGLPIPDTYFEHSSVLAQRWPLLSGRFGEQFIVKAIDARGGDANYLVKNPEEFAQVFADNPGREFVCQRFIPNQYDIRALVANRKLKLLLKRQRDSGGGHLNNTSQGAKGSLMQLSELEPAVVDLVERAAALFNREFAGVDLMFGPDNKPVILEVNASPQISTGAFINDKLDAYAEGLTSLL